MYAWIWHKLPGPAVVRALLALVLIAAVLYGLVQWVFPMIDAAGWFDNGAVE